MPGSAPTVTLNPATSMPATVYVLEGGAITVSVPAGMTLAKMVDATGRRWWSIVPAPEGSAPCP